jgi:hypothetical protein
MKSRGFWRAPRHLVLLVEDGKINIGDLGLLTLIALDDGERDGFHAVTCSRSDSSGRWPVARPPTLPPASP